MDLSRKTYSSRTVPEERISSTFSHKYLLRQQLSCSVPGAPGAQAKTSRQLGLRLWPASRLPGYSQECPRSATDMAAYKIRHST